MAKAAKKETDLNETLDTTNVVSMKRPNVTRRLISTKNIQLSKKEPGFSFSGKYTGTVQGAPFTEVDQKTGEVIEKRMTFCVFECPNLGRFKVNQDKGLLSAITDAMVVEGDWIEVVKLDKVSLSKGRTMNQYDVFSIDAYTAEDME